MSKSREDWLIKATDAMRAGLFKDAGHSVPPIKVSVGIPGGRNSKKAIGQHWSPQASDDKTSSVFISPVLDNGTQVLAVLVHELVHAVVGNEAKHGKLFKRAAVSVGLEGKMTSTVASSALQAKLTTIESCLGIYPHAKLNMQLSPIKKQTSRMIKMQCPDCEYIARTSQSNLDQHGPVLCPCNNEPMTIG